MNKNMCRSQGIGGGGFLHLLLKSGRVQQTFISECPARCSSSSTETVLGDKSETSAVSEMIKFSTPHLYISTKKKFRLVNALMNRNCAHNIL
jgi:hypothetical protein